MVSQHALDGLLQRLVSNRLALLGSDAADVRLAAVSEGHTLRAIAVVVAVSCATDKPLQLQVIERLEEVLIVNLEATLLESFVRHPHVLVVVAHLVGVGVQSAVRSNDAVAVEVMVRGRIATVVTTVGEYLLARNLALVAQSLVYEVPDVAALIFRILADDVPILLETTYRVTHGVRILTLYQRTGIVRLGIFLTVFVAHVHRTEDVGLAPVASLLILHRTRGVVSLDPVVHLFKVWTVAGLVAH